MIVYRGPSALGAGPILAVLTGANGRPSENRKTGALVQLWILPDVRLREFLAPRRHAWGAVCGPCPLLASGCYALAARCHAPLSILRTARAGRYPPWDGAPLGRAARLGAIGDPAALPRAVLRELVAAAPGAVGYTRAWAYAPQLPAVRWLREQGFMASVHTPAEAEAAAAAGWRYFRIGHSLAPGEARCRAERGRTCAQCEQCGPSGRVGGLVVRPHGPLRGRHESR